MMRPIQDKFPEEGISMQKAGGLPTLAFCCCESDPQTKGRLGAVSPMGTIVFSFEILSPRAQEQLRQCTQRSRKQTMLGTPENQR